MGNSNSAIGIAYLKKNVIDKFEIEVCRNISSMTILLLGVGTWKRG